MVPDIIALNSAINACKKNEKWSSAMDLLSAISISALGSMESFDPFSHNHGSVEKTGCVFEGNDPVGDFSRFFTKKKHDFGV